MPASTDIREGIAEAFDVLSDEFINGCTVTLLRTSENYDEFDTVLVVTSKRFFEYSNYRKNFLLEIADDSDDLTAALGNSTDELSATHVQVDDDIYIIRAGDTTPPKSTDVTWKVYCDAFEQKARYQVFT